MNARSKRSYIGVYQSGKAIMEDCILENSEVLDYIGAHPDYLVCGDIAYLGLEGFKASLSKNLLLLSNEENKEENSARGKEMLELRRSRLWRTHDLASPHQVASKFQKGSSTACGTRADSPEKALKERRSHQRQRKLYRSLFTMLFTCPGG